jgi:MFS family permease
MLPPMDDVLWPLRGVLLFLRSPRWWVRPMLGMLLALAGFIGLGLGIAWWLWPVATTTGWSWWLYAGIAVGLALAAVVVAWVLVLPLLLSFLLEDLARKANAYAKAHVRPGVLDSLANPTRAASHELPMVPGILASLKVVGGTLPVRIGWMATSFLSGLIIPPLGIVISALGMGHVACIDSIDIALSLRGFDGRQRLTALKTHRNEIRQSALTAGLLHLGLAATIVGWLFWLPGIVVGAALRTRTWEDPRGNDTPAPAPAPVPMTGGGASA